MHLELSWGAYLRAALVRNCPGELGWLEKAGAFCPSLHPGSGAAGERGAGSRSVPGAGLSQGRRDIC